MRREAAQGGAAFQGCGVAGFQTRCLPTQAQASRVLALADFEIGDTASLETCATTGLRIAASNGFTHF